MKKILLSTFLLANTYGADLLNDLQWGYKNTGQKYTVQDGKYSRRTVSGIPGIDINLPSYMVELEKKSEEVVVAVIDTGVDINHPDLKDRIWENPSCIGKTEDERKGIPCHGINYIDNSTDVTDQHGHGTHIAGIIGASHNSFGVNGASHNKIKIMPIKAMTNKYSGFFHNGKPTTELLVNSIAFAIKNGADVINISMGFPKILVGKKVQYIVDEALKRGIVIVAGAGNTNKDKPVFPCGYKGVLCVGGLDSTGNKVSSSNYGHKIDIFAPGESIVSTYPTQLDSDILRVNGYERKTGTSQAAPFVTALAALIKGQNKDLSANEVKSRILAGSRNLNLKDFGDIKFVDFSGALSLDKKIADSYPLLDLKSLDEITVMPDGRFSMDFGISIAKGETPFEATLKTKDSSVVLLDKKVNILVNENRNNLRYRGQITDINSKTDKEFILEVKSNDIALRKNIKVEFNNIVDKPISKKPISGIPSKSIIQIGKNNKVSFLQRVIKRDNHKLSQDYFFTRKNDLSRIYILAEKDESYNPTIIKINEPMKVSAIFKEDFNYDGKEDYLVYGATGDLKKYILAYYDSEGQPLIKNNIWKIKANLFSGLDFTRGHEDFAFLKVNFNGQDIGVPLFTKVRGMPFDDNSNDPIDRLLDIVKMRPYYLSPKTDDDGQTTMSLRTLANYEVITSLRKKLELNEFEDLDFGHILHQSESEKKSGVVKVIATYGEGMKKKAQILEFSSSHNYEFFGTEINKSLNKNDVQRLRIAGKDTYSDKAVFSTLFSRNFIRFFESEDENNDEKNLLLKTKSWSNLFTSSIDAFVNENSTSYYIESRYKVFHVEALGSKEMKVSTLPINRETSYPGLSFSESFQAISLGQGKHGVFTDTKSIYGNTVSVMTSVEGEFIRPISMNYKMKNHCVSLGVSEINGSAKLFAHCTNGKASWIEKVDITLRKE